MRWRKVLVAGTAAISLLAVPTAAWSETAASPAVQDSGESAAVELDVTTISFTSRSGTSTDTLVRVVSIALVAGGAITIGLRRGAVAEGAR